MPTYLEAIDDDSRCNYQFDMTGGSGKCVYIGNVLSGSGDVQIWVQDILGNTNTAVNPSQQRLSRTIPVTHPKCPYLYAHRISSMVGKGSGTATQASPTSPSNPSIGARPVANYYQYQQYEIGVEFASRPYPILSDDAFTGSVSGKWFTKNGTSNTFTYAPEWVRYCDFDLTPTDNNIQGQVGMLELVKDGGTGKFIPFNSPPWMWLPDQILKVKWYQVPYRFITSSNSYIAGSPSRNWKGRVNQNPWWFWPAGSLLYMGYSVTKYTPPINTIDTYTTFLPNSSDPTATGPAINYTRLCDIELTFLLTSRFMSGSLGASISNKNYVNAGHNLLPNLADNLFYYATRTPTGGSHSVQNPPAWFSFPVEAMFSDPDATGGPTTSGDN